jgi:hypothetical protein
MALHTPSTGDYDTPEKDVTTRMTELNITGFHVMDGKDVSPDTHMSCLEQIEQIVLRRRAALAMYTTPAQ